jgi:hypothetical protein
VPAEWRTTTASDARAAGRGMAGMFMVIGIDIPASGCWEIATHCRTQGTDPPDG